MHNVLQAYVCIFIEKSTCKWTHKVQIHIVQGTTVLVIQTFSKQLFVIVNFQWMGLKKADAVLNFVELAA